MTSIHTAHVQTIHRLLLEESATNPVLCTLDDQRQAVVKYWRNREGTLPLINEWCASCMAKLAELQIPDFGICRIDPDSKIEPTIPDGTITSNNYGIGFFTEYIPKTISYNRAYLRHFQPYELSSMILFDHLVYNTDRHCGNVLISVTTPPKLYLIDHSHIFKNQCIWDKNTFVQGMADEDYRDTRILEANADIYNDIKLYSCLDSNQLWSACKMFQSKLTEDSIHAIIGSIPMPWRNSIEEDIQALEKYINYRISNLHLTVEMILKEGGFS